MAAGPIQERNQDATVYVGGIDEKVTEALLWELFVQAGPVVSVHMPKDRITQQHQGYGFVEFLGEEDADYAMKIMNMIKLFGKPVRVNKAASHQKTADVGANLFIGNLDPECDEKLLYDTFSAFGIILQIPKIMRDVETGNSKGYAFINFASFEASDAAIEAMNGQYLCNRTISVCYAFKKDVKGERHGTAAERLLAAQNPVAVAERPHTMFADAPVLPAPGTLPPPPVLGGGLAPMPPPPPIPPSFPPVPGTTAPSTTTHIAPLIAPPPHRGEMFPPPPPGGFPPGPFPPGLPPPPPMGMPPGLPHMQGHPPRGFAPPPPPPPGFGSHPHQGFMPPIPPPPQPPSVE